MTMTSLSALLYLVLTSIQFLAAYKHANKNYLSATISGLILFGYSIVLQLTSTLDKHWYVVILSLTLIQLGLYELSKTIQTITVKHQLMRLVTHIVIILLLLRS